MAPDERAFPNVMEVLDLDNCRDAGDAAVEHSAQPDSLWILPPLCLRGQGSGSLPDDDSWPRPS